MTTPQGYSSITPKMIFLSLLLLFVGCQAPSDVSAPSTQGSAPTSTVPSLSQAVIWVDGVTCPFCTYNIERQLRVIPGVHNIMFTLRTGRVTLSFDPNLPPTKQQLSDAITKGGFTVRRIELP